jgi:phenylalanyl-tRNA synthetase alpha chain
MKAALHRLEKAVLVTLHRLGGRATYRELADGVAAVLKEAGLDAGTEPERMVSAVAKTCGWLSEKKYLVVEEGGVSRLLELGEEGRVYVVQGFPERRVVEFLKSVGGELDVENLRRVDGFEVGLVWARRLGWVDFVRREGRTYVVLKNEPPAVTEMEELVKKLSSGERVEVDALPSELVQQLLRRQKVVKIQEQRVLVAVLTEQGKAVAAELAALPVTDLFAEVTKLTPELIRSGGYKTVTLSPYDVAAPTPPVFAAKRHPLNEVIRLVKQTYVEMGFEEIKGPIVELAFWNFDALFQPQDHPAREMQDTFYLLYPERGEPPAEYVDEVRAVHENGGRTGSRGWGYKWTVEEASRLVLRTHTTATTIRHLAQAGTPPVKVFCVDRIFRNEKVDWKHLAEFHQIEGIVVEKGANLRMLMGVLRDFYHRLGLREVRFRPSYFPYTEPSMEVEVRLGGRWLELGGSGIFRPETTYPFRVYDPVLAWGLGLERLAMVIYGLEDIRTFHLNDLKWLRNTSPLKPLTTARRT